MDPQEKWGCKVYRENRVQLGLPVFKVPLDHLAPRVMLAQLDNKDLQVVQEVWDHRVLQEFQDCVDQVDLKEMLALQAHLGHRDKQELLALRVQEVPRETLVSKELKDIQVLLV